MHKSFLIFIIILSILSASLLSAAPVEKRILSNGLTLITQEDHSKKLISICGYVNGGGRTETPDLAGLSHYFEHLIFRGGTSKQEELEMRKAFLSLGKFYGYTSEDATCYYITVPPENLPEALDRYVDVLLNLELNEKKVETERGIVLAEFGQSYFDIPGGMAYFNLYQTAFTNHPYGQTVIGDTAVVGHATLETFQKFYDERYTPDQFIIAAVGDFDTESLISEFENTFGKFPPGGKNFEQNRIESVQTEFKTVDYKMPVSAVNIALGFHIPPFSSPEFPALEILNLALFDYPDGLLTDKLTVSANKFNYIGGWLDRTKDPGLWVIYAESSPEKTNEAVPDLFTELRQIAEHGLPEKAIESAKKKLIRQDKASKESLFSRAEGYCLYELSSNIGLVDYYGERISNVSGEAIQRLASRIITPENATLSLVLPSDTEAPDAKSWGNLLRAAKSEKTVSKRTVPPVKETILSNGAAVLMQADPSDEMASMKVYVRGGSWAEPAGKEGLNDFLCRLLARETLELSSGEFSQKVGDLGLDIHADADADYSVMTLSGTADVFTEGVELTGLAFTRPGFSVDLIESVRREMKAEITGMADQTYDLTRQEFDALIYKNNPYKRPVHGFPESIDKITREDLMEHHRKIYTGKNIIISVVGGFDPGKVKDLIDIYFGEIEPGMQFKYDVKKEQLPTKPVEKIVKKDRALITYNQGWTAPSVSSGDFLPMKIASYMLNKIMFFRFVYEEGICYRMWTRYDEKIGPGKFWFETGIYPKDYQFSRTEVFKEFNDFLMKKVTDEDLELFRKEAVQKIMLETETSAERADEIAKYYLFGFGADYLDTFPQKVSAVSVKDVKRVINNYLKPGNYSVLVVGNPEK